MRYQALEYGKFLMSLEESPDSSIDVLKKFVAFLQKTGDIKDWRKILEAYEFLHTKKTAGKKATVRFKGEIDREKIKNDLKNFEIDFIEDKTLLGGISIKIGDEKIENSLRGRLEEIRKNLTK